MNETKSYYIFCGVSQIDSLQHVHINNSSALFYDTTRAKPKTCTLVSKFSKNTVCTYKTAVGHTFTHTISSAQPCCDVHFAVFDGDCVVVNELHAAVEHPVERVVGALDVTVVRLPALRHSLGLLRRHKALAVHPTDAS